MTGNGFKLPRLIPNQFHAFNIHWRTAYSRPLFFSMTYEAFFVRLTYLPNGSGIRRARVLS